MESKNYTLLKNGEILQYNGNDWLLLTKDVLINGNKIEKIGNFNVDNELVSTVIDCSGKVIVPGLQNCHSHLIELWQRSLHEQLPLEPWIPYKSNLDALLNLTPKEIEAIIRLACLELLRNGVTSIVEHMYQRPMITQDSIDAVITAFSDLRIRSWLGPGMVDIDIAKIHGVNLSNITNGSERDLLTNNPTLTKDEQLDLTKYVIEKVSDIDNSLVTPIVGPAGPTFCSYEMIEESIELSNKHNLLLHMHVLESRNQRSMAMDRYGMGTLEYLHSLGALNERFFGAHVIWVSSEEIELIADTDSNVVSNPYSNLRLGSGFCPVTDLFKYDVNVALGSDGGNSSDTYAILDQARAAALLNRANESPEYWIKGEDAFTMATVNGGKILTNGKTGNIIEGQLADLVIMEKDFRHISPAPMARTLVNTGFGKIKYVMVDGEIVMKDGQSLFYDESEDIEVLTDIVKRGQKHLQEANEIGDLLYPFLKQRYDNSVNEYIDFIPGKSSGGNK